MKSYGTGLPDLQVETAYRYRAANCRRSFSTGRGVFDGMRKQGAAPPSPDREVVQVVQWDVPITSD